jgi:hypothetical protein
VSSPKAFSISIALRSDPAWDKKESGVGRRGKMASALVEKNMNMAAPILFLKKISSNAQQQLS